MESLLPYKGYRERNFFGVHMVEVYGESGYVTFDTWDGDAIPYLNENFNEVGDEVLEDSKSNEDQTEEFDQVKNEVSDGKL